MKFHLFKVTGYEEAIMSLRFSRGKHYSFEKAQQIQDLVYVVTDQKGFLIDPVGYHIKLATVFNEGIGHAKITGDYDKDVAEFKRLLGINLDNAMGHHDHHTLMKYITISFITDGLHRGAQDDLDAHAMGFNNRITRFSTRLATISDVEVSEWYEDKIIPFHTAHKMIHEAMPLDAQFENRFAPGTNEPAEIEHNGDIFVYTPFGYVLQKYAEMNEEASIRKDVIRGLIHLGTPGPAIWMTDLFNLRYIYYRRGKLTKANPELKIGMEQLADQIEASIPVYGEKFRYEFTDSGKWEHMHNVKTISLDEWKEFQAYKSSSQSAV